MLPQQKCSAEILLSFFLFFSLRLRRFWTSLVYKSILSIYPTPPLGQDMTQGQFLSSFYQVWIQSFPSPRRCLTKAEEPSLPYYLPIAGGRIIGFIPFPRVLVLCEMQSVSSRIWTCVTVSISYDNKHYTTGTSYKSVHAEIHMHRNFDRWDIIEIYWDHLILLQLWLTFTTQKVSNFENWLFHHQSTYKKIFIYLFTFSIFRLWMWL